MVGDKTLARSVTQAWISEARTAESLLSPMEVPSMCLLIKDSTLVAVVWRCGLFAAHLRAYSPTVTGFASLTYAPDNLAPSTAARCRSASALRVNVRDRSRPSGSSQRARYLRSARF